MSSSIEYAPTSLGSDIRFVRSVSQAYVFRQWRGLELASAGRLGVAAGIGEQDLIPSERFFAGGPGTVRGVVEGSLGPIDPFFNEPTGGKSMVVLNQEVRVPINKWVRGVGFFDAGNVFERWRDVRLGELVGSVGAGVRISTPLRYCAWTTRERSGMDRSRHQHASCSESVRPSNVPGPKRTRPTALRSLSPSNSFHDLQHLGTLGRVGGELQELLEMDRHAVGAVGAVVLSPP
jgi:hypothetical protein